VGLNVRADRARAAALRLAASAIDAPNVAKIFVYQWLRAVAPQTLDNVRDRITVADNKHGPGLPGDGRNECRRIFGVVDCRFDFQFSREWCGGLLGSFRIADVDYRRLAALKPVGQQLSDALAFAG